MSNNIIKHFSHEHHLRLANNITWWRNITCRICNSVISKGETAYVCLKMYSCDWYFSYGIHKKCAEFPQHMTTHSLHPLDHHSITLAITSSKSTTNILCSYCDNPFSADYYAYSCDHCPDFQMHPACGTLPLPSLIIPSDDEAIRFACHNRPMALTEDKIIGNCFACNSPWSGPAYSCDSTQQCPNFFHKSCGDQLRLRITRHPFHPHHNLALRVSKPRPCGSCGRKDCRLIYGCLDGGCGFEMCTECASYDSVAVECRSHDHLLCLVEKACFGDIHCHACNTSYAGGRVPEEVRRTKSLVFHCMEYGCFDLHFLCGPLLSRVEYEYHVHPLTLVDASKVEDDSDPGEHYCDACEEERDPQFRVYYCKECKYVAHIHCLLSQIMKVLKGDHTKYVKLMALGDDRWDFGNEQGTKANNQELSMRDIMKTLTQEELQRLTNPLNLDIKANFINQYHYWRSLNSEYVNLKAPMENIDGVQKLFSVDMNKFDEFMSETMYFVDYRGLKLEEEYMRQKVEEVEGYMVPKTLAPIFRTLLRNNREFFSSANSLPLGMKSFVAALLCAVVERMCRTKFEDITRDDLPHWYFYLRIISYIFAGSSGNYLTYLDSIEKFAMRAFLGNEAIRCERKASETLALKEAELKRYKENYQKLEACMAEKSDFMEECIRMASEFKGKYLADKLL